MDATLDRSRRFVVQCGVGPLAAGTAIFLLWLITRWDLLMIAGVLMLYVGTFVVLVGLVALVLFHSQAKRAGLPPKQRNRTTLACLLLLLVNFPAAAVIVATSNVIFRRHVVEVHNDTAMQLHNVRVVGGGCDVILGTIAAGGTARASLWPEHEDGLELTTEAAEERHYLDVYLCPSVGSRITVDVGVDGEVRVRQRSS